MKKEIIKRTKLTAEDGMVLTNGEVYSKEVYLGSDDSPENWHEITEEEYAEIQKAMETEEREE